MDPDEEWMLLIHYQLDKESIEIPWRYEKRMSNIKRRMISKENRDDYYEWYPIKFTTFRGLINNTYYINIAKKSKDFGKFLLEISGNFVDEIKYEYVDQSEVNSIEPLYRGFNFFNFRTEPRLKKLSKL
jgi:hypothetical protein